MQRHTKGVAVRGINLADVKAIPMVVPPPGLQAKFKCRLESIEKLVEAGRSSLNELDDLFASLQHRAFRGEL
jgi:type I restriction enzyme S subunit